jgi:hypothetical protein
MRWCWDHRKLAGAHGAEGECGSGRCIAFAPVFCMALFWAMNETASVTAIRTEPYILVSRFVGSWAKLTSTVLQRRMTNFS